MTEGWVNDVEVASVMYIKLYKGPDLPHKSGRKLYFAIEWCETHEEESKLVAGALESLGKSHKDYNWDRISKEKVYRSTADWDSFYLMTFKLIPLRGKLTCCKCGFRPWKSGYTSAYYAVPLNEEAWPEWECPDCKK